MTLTDIITALGAILTGVGLIYAGIQIKLSRKTTRSQFLLQLYQLMEQHNEVHARLTGLGWSDGKTGPDTVEEWIKVGRALGLFEYINILVKDGLIEIDTVDKLYSYRLFHLVNNEIIRNRHFNAHSGWDGVIELLTDLKDKRMFKLLSQQYGVNHLNLPPENVISSDRLTQHSTK
jgi:hypothetical protein